MLTASRAPALSATAAGTWPSAASLRQARLRAGAFTRMVRGEGALVFDDGGRRYVDPTASL